MDILSYMAGLPEDIKLQALQMLEHYERGYKGMLAPSKRSHTKAVKATYEAVDRSISSFLEKNHTTCRKGCAYCCHILVYTTTDEAMYINNYCKHNGIGINMGVILEQSKYTVDNWASQEFNRCVFLDVDNTCKIYEVRPLSCRKYYVATDPKFCDVSSGPYKIAILNNFELEIMVSGIYNAIGMDSLPRQLLNVCRSSKGN